MSPSGSDADSSESQTILLSISLLMQCFTSKQEGGWSLARVSHLLDSFIPAYNIFISSHRSTLCIIILKLITAAGSALLMNTSILFCNRTLASDHRQSYCLAIEYIFGYFSFHRRCASFIILFGAAGQLCTHFNCLFGTLQRLSEVR